MKYMDTRSLDIGITNTSYYAYSDEMKFKLMVEDGYKCVDYQQLAYPYTPLYELPLHEFEAKLLDDRKNIEESGLYITQAHAPWVWSEPRDRTPQERKRWLEFTKQAIDGASILGAPNFVFHPLLPYNNTSDNPEEVLHLNREFAAAIADYAAQYGITVCMENLPFLKYPLGSAQAVCELVDSVDRENLRVCLDTGHAAMFDADVANAVHTIGNRLRALHIHDNMGDADSHLNIGDGIIDWDSFAVALHDIGYNGVISLETSPRFRKAKSERWYGMRTALAEKARRIATIAACGIIE